MTAKTRSHWKEYATAFCATLVTATAGTCYGWPSPTLPYLLSSDSSIPTTHAEGSWIVSIMILCSAITPVPSAYLADKFGRKTTLLLGAIPFIIGWVLVIVAKSVPILYVARMFSGLGYGVVYTVAPMYTGEIATNEVRGALSTLITLMNKVGILAQYCIGPFVTMRTLASINLILPITFIITFIFLPESPYYYLKFERSERAERSLRNLRTGDIRTELKNIEINVQEDMKNRGTWGDLITEATNRKAMLICLGIFTIQQLCGSAAVVAYAQVIFNCTSSADEGGTSIEPYQESIILGCVQVATCVLSVILVDRVGRKPLLLLSALGVGLMNGTIGTYFFFDITNKGSVDFLNWLPLASLLIYIVCYAIGLSTVPYVIIGEMFPTNVKLYASCIAHIYTGISMFAVQKLFQVGILAQYCIGPFVTMRTLASINLILPITFIITFIFLPESPYYYLKFERSERAERSLRNLRTGDIRTELKNIEINVQEDMKNRGTWGDLITEATNRKAMLICLGIFTIQQLCGSAAVVAYAQVIFNCTSSADEGGTSIEPYQESIILGCVQVATCVLSVILVDRVGRKPLLLLSALGVGLMNGTIGTYFFFDITNKGSVDFLNWLPLASLLIYIVCYAIGLSTVPYVIIGEMFPTNVKLYASCIAHIYTGISMFAVQKLFQVVKDAYEIYTVFWGFSAFSLIGLVFMLAVVPETKGKSFASIQTQLRDEVARDSATQIATVEY